MSRNQKGFGHFFLILIVSLIIFAGIGYYAFKNGQISFSPSEQNTTFNTPTPTFNVTDNWHTYTEKILGFEIKYPLEWKKLDFDFKIEENWESGINFQALHSPDSTISTNNQVVQGTALSFFVYHKSDFSKDEIINSTGTNDEVVITSYKSDFIEGTLVEDIRQIPIYKNSNRKILITEDNSNIIAIMAIWPINHSENEITIDQILSTFKFTD